MTIKKLKAKLKLILGRRYLTNRVLLAKAIIYRFFSVSITFLLAFFFTENVSISLSISAVDFFGQTLLYFIFDVSWNNMIERQRNEW